MSDNHRKTELQDLIRRHQESVRKQDEVYMKNFQSRVKPVGAGLDSDDLSKVAGTDVIGKGSPEEDLRK
jgi:hypothetical protein